MLSHNLRYAKNETLRLNGETKFKLDQANIQKPSHRIEQNLPVSLYVLKMCERFFEEIFVR